MTHRRYILWKIQKLWFLILGKLGILKALGHCGQCRRWFVYPRKRRMNTAYVDEEQNFCTFCEDCFEDIQAYWQERWDDYNSGRL